MKGNHVHIFKNEHTHLPEEPDLRHRYTKADKHMRHVRVLSFGLGRAMLAFWRAADRIARWTGVQERSRIKRNTVIKARPPRKCDECGKLAEWPQALSIARVIDENGEMIEYEYPLCKECLEQMEMERGLEKAARRGEICGLCYKPLEPPGGTTVDLGVPWFAEEIPGQARLIRACRACSDKHRGSTQS
jgi:hypothetical protein